MDPLHEGHIRKKPFRLASLASWHSGILAPFYANMSDTDKALLKAKLNLDTSLIAWHELQYHFAAGCVISVSPELDLVEAALSVSADEKEKIEQWLVSGMMGRVSDGEARIWYDSKATLWAVVVKPWVFVQEKRPDRLQ